MNIAGLCLLSGGTTQPCWPSADGKCCQSQEYPATRVGWVPSGEKYRVLHFTPEFVHRATWRIPGAENDLHPAPHCAPASIGPKPS
jgi:hypothetical protein